MDEIVREDSQDEKGSKIPSCSSQSDSVVTQNDLSSDSDDKLTICTNLPVKKRKLKRKCLQENLAPVQEVTEAIPEIAGTKNLSPGEIRAILKKVVSNDHVLAMVRLKEEEMAAEAEEEVEVERESADLMPKLTRLKAKELNKQLPGIIPLTLKPPEEESETAMLITMDLDEEDDCDEEYKPEEDLHSSDDETNTSVSDMDSLPATPGDAVSVLESGDDSVKYSKDGLFKIPQICASPSPAKKGVEPFRPPALGTRSKVSLAKTTIEDIEETFVPPDITTDMYDFDCDIDNVWQEFLTQFRRPLTIAETHEEDDEADPEYVAADQIPLDKEELREVKVSRKELSDLMAELFDGIDDDVICPEVPVVDEEEAGGARTKPTPTKYQKNRPDETPGTPESIMPFHIMTHSTPISYQPVQEIPEVLDMSTVLENSLDMEESEQKPEISSDWMDLSSLESPKEIFHRIMELKFQQMSRLRPAEVFEDGQVGFTDYQRQILAQQLRMHVQLCVQHFIQTYSHPELWRQADKPMAELTELWNMARSNRNSAFNAINLAGGVELCESWKQQMNVINVENQQLIKEHEESARLEERKKNCYRWSSRIFNPRIIHLMTNSNVFLYPKLLPSVPFRVSSFFNNFQRHESAAIAYFYDTVYQDLREQARCQKKYVEPSRMKVCEKISLFICQWRTPNQIYKFIYREKNSEIMNPIKFYFENQHLLPVSHVLESINPNQVLAELPTSCLPKTWENFLQAEKKRKLKAQKDKELEAKKRKRVNLIQKIQAQKKNRSEVRKELPDKQIQVFSSDSFLLGLSETEGILREKLERTLKAFKQCLEEQLRGFKKCPILSKIFNFIREFEIFASLLWRVMQADKRIREATVDCEEDRGEVKKLKATEQKRHKHRLHDSNRLLLLPERQEDLMQRDSVYSWNFFEKVECTFKAAKQFDKFERFLTILNAFKPGKDEVPDLYYRLEDLFLPDHPELAELFLTFLLPGHAAQVGKFFEHFILTNMHTLLVKMNTYFAKQPHQLKKIYACLNELTHEEGLTMDKIKGKFLPLLKGNQLLTDWFLQLFPNERPPASDSDEFEVITLKKHVTEEEIQKRSQTEEIPADRLTDPFDNAPCSIKYMQGRIYYGNRVLLPAELSFLASQEIDSRMEKSRESDPPTCVHEIKQAWDLKIQEGLNGPTDPGPLTEELNETPPKLCDYPTLKMHAYRLNPHAITSEMVLACQEGVEEGKTSPKKSSGSKKNPSSPKRTAGKGGAKPQETDTAIEMARRLKMFLTAEEKPPKPRRVRQKKPPEEEEEKEEKVKPEKVQTDEDVTWTRDQDKMILEVINGELDSEEEVIERLVELMEDRTRDQITARFHFLLNVLRKFQTDD